ncbi:GlnD UTP,GlnB (protein PII) uridylyltransferase [Candidatus Nanopelagicaceae bacterium]
MGTRERRERSNESDRLISSLFTGVAGVALAAVGGYGRGELAPGSDLDILFLHNGRVDDQVLGELINKILYPLWDKSFKVDHSVRTRVETRDAASDDLKVALGLLDIRLICGDADLVAAVQNDAIADWREKSRERLPQLRASLIERHLRSGELAYLLEPDLKEARGGLRDITALRAVALSGAVSVSLEQVSAAESVLMSAREALHEVTGRDKDRLLFQEQDKVAENLEYLDADELMSAIAQAARSVDYLLESTWHRLDHRGKDGLGRFLKRPRSTQVAPGITIAHQEVSVIDTYDLAADPVIGIRAAAIAAQAGLPIAPATLQRLMNAYRDGAGQMPNPWPRAARENLIALIGAGQPMVRIWEALDQEEILFNWLPEWRAVRSLPQRNVLHRHTVDRHMVETAVFAAALTRRVHRPDLLLFAALFHDIGKGTQEDHSDRGERLIQPLAARIGFSDPDIATLKLLIKHHLLLSATATRRDLDDPATIASVTSVIPDLQTLELLHALSIADGQATGRAAWSDWKESLLSELVSRVTSALTDNTIATAPIFTEEQLNFARTGELRVIIEDRDPDFVIEIIAPDKPGLLSVVAGVLNLARFDVRSARTQTVEKSAVMKWLVTPNQYAPTVDSTLIHQMIADALADASELSAKISQRIADYANLPTIPVPSPVVETFMDAATDATIIEVRSHDRPALLFGIGDVITKCQIDIKSAIVTTLGAEAIDTLYVTEIGGGGLSAARAQEVADRLSAVLA